ncbi:MAG: hypothetical protein M1817_002479 [Caeruleum heppii]|nr:MAG: hypothetical protein M1817_002479 [Caeruleum heppii]
MERDQLSVGGIDSQVKLESDQAATLSGLSDDDVYEDAGDLDFTDYDSGVFLMKVPKWLWENWAKIGDDEQIELGKIRLESCGRDEHGKEKSKFTMILSPSVKHNKGLPREYDVNVMNDTSNNTFIFSEKDLPGYRTKDGAKSRFTSHETKGKTPYSLNGAVQQGRIQKWEKGKRSQPYYKRAIPKQTALAAVINHEVTCLPVENEEYQGIMDAMARGSLKPKRETKFIEGVGATAGNLLAPGTLGSTGNFGKFIKTSAPARAKAGEHKSARIPQNELLDLIYECFGRYSYWPFKALKNKLNQPEAYLKSTLEIVAELVKSGRFALTWTLKPENKVAHYAEISEELAPDAGDRGDEALDDDNGDAMTSDGDDEEEVKMENVLPS